MGPNLMFENVTEASALFDSTSDGLPESVAQVPLAAPGSLAEALVG